MLTSSRLLVGIPQNDELGNHRAGATVNYNAIMDNYSLSACTTRIVMDVT